MKHVLIAIIAAIFPLTAAAESAHSVTSDVVQNHILPRFESLATRSSELSVVAKDECNASSPALRTAYAEAFDAWISASHLRFGPTEIDDRAFALAFWPDSRGATPKTLGRLITDQDAVANSVDSFAEVSIAARGFYAMEFLLYDETLSAAGDDAYRCTLIQAITADIASNTAAILADWQESYAARLLEPSPDGTYRSDEEAVQELFKALSAGLEFTADTRLGRPLGTFDRPRPTRAEAWRSGRSSRHVGLSLRALRDLAIRLSADNAEVSGKLEAAFDRAINRLAALDDPIFAGTAQPQSRIRVEAIQQSVHEARDIVRDELGPKLGVAAGFNSLDGD